MNTKHKTLYMETRTHSKKRPILIGFQEAESDLPGGRQESL
jgi:hypothetical protein